MTEERITFSFGKNWDEFIRRHYSEDRLRTAQKHLLSFLRVENLKGRSFLDIGCGSGLSSLAAFDAGVSQLVSFDIDPMSIRATQYLRKLRSYPNSWQILEGSILDSAFLAAIQPADVVYSWGVLHHTGAMWKAIENAATLIKEGGLFYIALYTTTPATPYWIEIKKRYNRASSFQKRLMEYRYVFRHHIRPALSARKNPLTVLCSINRTRGMDFMTDVRDWLGGYPYEDAKPEEVFLFCTEKLGLRMINLATGEANTEYLFVKASGH